MCNVHYIYTYQHFKWLQITRTAIYSTDKSHVMLKNVACVQHRNIELRMTHLSEDYY